MEQVEAFHLGAPAARAVADAATNTSDMADDASDSPSDSEDDTSDSLSDSDNGTSDGDASDAGATGVPSTLRQLLVYNAATEGADLSSEAIAALVRAGGDIDAMGGYSDGTALHVAVSSNHLSNVRALLTAGAETTLADDDGLTPLMMAATEDQDDAIRALLTAGADPNYWPGDQDDEDDDDDCIRGPPLVLAAGMGHADAVCALLESPRIEVDLCGTTHSTALFHAANASGCASCTEQLLDAGANVDGAGHNPMSPFLGAALNSHMDAMQLLASAGADVDEIYFDGGTALTCSVEYEHEQYRVPALLRMGATIPSRSVLDELTSQDHSDYSAVRRYLGDVVAAGGIAAHEIKRVTALFVKHRIVFLDLPEELFHVVVEFVDSEDYPDPAAPPKVDWN